jgi:hypothetical protein
MSGGIGTGSGGGGKRGTCGTEVAHEEGDYEENEEDIYQRRGGGCGA